jgi:hypothetical protein
MPNNRTRTAIPENVRAAFRQVYDEYRRNHYDHVQALKAARDVILDVAEGQARQETGRQEGFWRTLGQMAANAGALTALDNQLNALIVENL